jgi:amidase
MFKTEEGLPIGAQFIANKGNEYLLLQLAKQIEEVGLLDTGIVTL